MQMTASALIVGALCLLARIAGYPAAATYSLGHGHIFDAKLVHKTETVQGSGGIKLGVFISLRM